MAATSGRRRRRDEMDDDSEDADSQQLDVSSPASDSSKRPRLNPASESESESEPSSRATVNGDANANGLPPGDFQPGAIVRVSVENFVTYSKADFFPGPHLNMVIGPNGTGKSSLVCAICLGLGYSPKHLGRAGSVKEFVKHGEDTATVEIELKKKPRDRSNYVIRVQIRREQNSQKWWLNGKETSHKNIQALMRSLKIQVDNLCQFLPQDRVVEFAACTPIDLLHETLRAAAPEEMLRWQKQLQDLHKDKKEMSGTAHSDAENLRNLENRQQGLQADVDRIRERQEIQEKVHNLRDALIVAKYTEARDQHRQAKDRKKAAESALRRLERESGPSLEAVNQKQEYARKIRSAVVGRDKALHDAEMKTKVLASKVIAATDEIKDFDDKLEAEGNGFDAKKKRVAASKSKITAFQADLKNRPTEFNPGDWNQKIRAEEHNWRELEAEERQLSTQVDSLKEKGRAKQLDVQKYQKDVASFDTQAGQQLNFMKKVFPEVAAGWEWVQAHQDDFEQEVFGPPMISCSVKDERYSDQVQSLLQIDDFTCFTAQTKKDYKKLTDQLYRVMSLSVVIRTCHNALESFRAPVSQEEAARLGLDGFAIDFLEGPAPVLAMLCSEKRLHMCGVTLQNHSDAQFDELVSNGAVNSWAAGNQSFTVRRRREYGPQAMTAVTKNIQQGRFWTSQPVDFQEKAELNRRLVEAKGEIELMKEELRSVKDKRDSLEDQKVEISNKIDQLRSEKNSLQKEFQKWQSLPEKLESEERLKESHERDMREARKKMSEIQYEWDDAVVRRAELVIQHTATIEQFREAHQALIEANLWLVEANSDVQGLKDRNAGIMQSLDEEREKVQTAIEDAGRTRAAGMQLGDQVREIIADDEAKQVLLSQLSEGKTPDEVELEISAEEAQLELIHAANPNVIVDFERRAQEIARLRHKMNGLTEKLGAVSREVDELMGKWEPQLDQLVSRINDAFAYNFEQISCAGEVRVHKDDDFDLWAMEVMVKFRENEALQQLTAHRQSGGERAVSTIFYLMALQSLAQSPFRVVDEINQGMDPRNERMVHERMVEIACREHTSQYFLITPKLLTGLRYDPRMRVLCIASGEHMPREGRKLDFARCLRIQKGLMAGA